MRFLALFLALLIGGSAMARDIGPRPAPKPQTGSVVDPEQAYMDELWEEYAAGRMTMQQAMELYDKKFGAPDLMGRSQGPALGPVVPPLNGRR